jgi:site-specific DNA recombinase
MPADVKLLRCAIYTRKSTEHGLEQEFNSLDAQRESLRGLHQEPGLAGLESTPPPL